MARSGWRSLGGERAGWRSAAVAGLMLGCAGMGVAQTTQTTAADAAQAAAQGPVETLQVQSQLVLVPTTVQTKKGEMIYNLRPDQFEVKVDGVAQRVRIDDADDVRPISLAVVVQCSRDAPMEMGKWKGLETMVDQLVGGAPAHVAVMDFGNEPELLTNFTANPARRNKALAEIEPCEDESGNAMFDTVAYAAKLFDEAKTPGRRVILLVSETRDHGSKAKAQDVIRALGRSNIVVDAVAFSPARDEMVEDLKHSDGANGGVIGLVLAAVQALRKNAAKEFARQSGGEYINFASGNKFDFALNGLANRVNNYYLLTFQPQFPPPAPGAERVARGPLHNIAVRVPTYPDAVIHHREMYWETAQ